MKSNSLLGVVQKNQGRWLGRAIDYGDKICHYILTDDTEQLHCTQYGTQCYRYYKT